MDQIAFSGVAILKREFLLKLSSDSILLWGFSVELTTQLLTSDYTSKANFE